MLPALLPLREKVSVEAFDVLREFGNLAKFLAVLRKLRPTGTSPGRFIDRSLDGGAGRALLFAIPMAAFVELFARFVGLNIGFIIGVLDVRGLL